jgi:preprotein translocase subunit SecG
MNTFSTIIVVIQVLSALGIIGLVLLQHGKGADMGAAFGSGASGSLFGATGSSNFLSKLTAVSAVIFFAATLALAFIGNRPASSGGVMDNLPATTAPANNAPAVDPSIPVPAGQFPAEAPSKSAPAAGNAGPSSEIPK